MPAKNDICNMSLKIDHLIDFAYIKLSDTNQVLQLCTARTVLSDAVIRPVRSVTGTIQMMTQQTSHDSVILTEDNGVIRGFPIDSDQ